MWSRAPTAAATAAGAHGDVPHSAQRATTAQQLLPNHMRRKMKLTCSPNPKKEKPTSMELPGEVRYIANTKLKAWGYGRHKRAPTLLANVSHWKKMRVAVASLACAGAVCLCGQMQHDNMVRFRDVSERMSMDKFARQVR